MSYIVYVVDQPTMQIAVALTRQGHAELVSRMVNAAKAAHTYAPDCQIQIVTSLDTSTLLTCNDGLEQDQSGIYDHLPSGTWNVGQYEYLQFNYGVTPYTSWLGIVNNQMACGSGDVTVEQLERYLRL